MLKCMHEYDTVLRKTGLIHILTHKRICYTFRDGNCEAILSPAMHLFGIHYSGSWYVSKGGDFH